MARFATDCVYRLQKLVKALEKTLGPDTGDIGGRFGLHSGQVIAGVLRGDKGRFQLFGSVINLASRMESTGVSFAVVFEVVVRTLRSFNNLVYFMNI